MQGEQNTWYLFVCVLMVQRQDFWKELSVCIWQKLIIQRCRESVEKNCKTKHMLFLKSKHDMLYNVLLYFFCNEKVSIDKKCFSEAGGLENNLCQVFLMYMHLYFFISTDFRSASTHQSWTLWDSCYRKENKQGKEIQSYVS